MQHFNPFYKQLTAQREAIFSLKSKVTDPMAKAKIDDYLTMFNQFNSRICTSDGVSYQYNGNIDSDKLYGKNGNTCDNVYALKEFGDKLIVKK